MAKRKQFNVEIKEAANDSAEQTILDVLINDQPVGTVVEESPKSFQASFADERPLKWPTVDEAVEYIISQYNLHGLKK